jgi:hypothetical protein
MANIPKKGKRKKIPPSPPPQKEKTRPLSLVPFIDCMKFLFLKLFVTIFRLGYNPISGTYLYYNSAQSLLNGPPLSNFVDRGLGEWEWLGPGSTKINKDYLYYNFAHGPQNGPCPLSHNTATFLSLKPVLHNTGPF